MIRLYESGAYLVNGTDLYTDPEELTGKTGIVPDKEELRKAQWPTVFSDHTTKAITWISCVCGLIP